MKTHVSLVLFSFPSLNLTTRFSVDGRSGRSNAKSGVRDMALKFAPSSTCLLSRSPDQLHPSSFFYELGNAATAVSLSEVWVTVILPSCRADHDLAADIMLRREPLLVPPEVLNEMLADSRSSMIESPHIVYHAGWPSELRVGIFSLSLNDK
jgi:hypothetical protein